MRGMLCGHISCRSITFPLIHSYSTSLLISELFQSCKSYKSRKSVSPHKTPHKTATCHYCPPVNKTNKKTYKMLLSSDIRALAGRFLPLPLARHSQACYLVALSRQKTL